MEFKNPQDEWNKFGKQRLAICTDLNNNKLHLCKERGWTKNTQETVCDMHVKNIFKNVFLDYLSQLSLFMKICLKIIAYMG